MNFNFNFKRYLSAPVLATTLAVSTFMPTQASAGSEAYIGEVMMFAGNYCPKNYAEANGQLLSIASNTTMFAILGTNYGGDGRTTFGLPDLRGRAPVGRGQSAGGTVHRLGNSGGRESTHLSSSNLPAQSLSANAITVNTDLVGKAVGLAKGKKDGTGSLSLSTNIGGQAFSIQSPFLVMRYCIATQGLFPIRN